MRRDGNKKDHGAPQALRDFAAKVPQNADHDSIPLSLSFILNPIFVICTFNAAN